MKKSALITVIIIFIAGTIAYGYSINAKYKQTLTSMAATPEAPVEQPTEPVEEENNEEEPVIMDKQKSNQPFILLLFGISTREALNDQGRADTIMLALVDPAAARIKLISIPRDTYVDIPGYGFNKINAAYPRGGAVLLKQTIENWLDFNIHGYANINFQGFIDLVDLVGGIRVNVPRDMRYDDLADGTHIDLKKGEQLLDGKNALDFVRFRMSNDGRHASDYDRMGRQQLALAELSKNLSSIRMIARIHRIMDILSANVKTSLTVEELDALIKNFYAIDMQALETTSMQGGGYLINESWYEVVPEEEIQRIRAIMDSFMDVSAN